MLQTCCNIKRKKNYNLCRWYQRQCNPVNLRAGFRFREAMAFDASESQVHRDLAEAAVYQYEGVR